MVIADWWNAVIKEEGVGQVMKRKPVVNNQCQPLIRIADLLGHWEMHRLPVIRIGCLSWEPHEFIDFDGDGKVRSRSIFLGGCWNIPKEVNAPFFRQYCREHGATNLLSRLTA